MTWLLVLGFIGQAFFFSRFLVQWALSERAGRSLTPRIFWWLSLSGAVLLAVYTLQRRELVLLVGYSINGAIYARNLWLQARAGSRVKHSGTLVLLALAAAGALVAAAVLKQRADAESSTAWLACAVLGQGFWSSRFVVQWWASERSGHSHFPVVFWWLSLAGNVLLLAYAIHRRDAVLIAGYAPGPLVQVRNLMLARRGGIGTLRAHEG